LRFREEEEEEEEEEGYFTLEILKQNSRD